MHSGILGSLTISDGGQARPERSTLLSKSRAASQLSNFVSRYATASPCNGSKGKSRRFFQIPSQITGPGELYPCSKAKIPRLDNGCHGPLYVLTRCPMAKIFAKLLRPESPGRSRLSNRSVFVLMNCRPRLPTSIRNSVPFMICWGGKDLG